MYGGIFVYIHHNFRPDVSKYSIHGAFGIHTWSHFRFHQLPSIDVFAHQLPSFFHNIMTLGGVFKYVLCSCLFEEDGPILTRIFFNWVETTLRHPNTLWGSVFRGSAFKVSKHRSSPGVTEIWLGCLGHQHMIDLHSLKLTACPWELGVGRRSFPFGEAYFKGWAASFREGMIFFLLSTHPSLHFPQESVKDAVVLQLVPPSLAGGGLMVLESQRVGPLGPGLGMASLKQWTRLLMAKFRLLIW